MTANVDAPDPGDAHRLIPPLASELGHAFAADYMPFELYQLGPRYEMLDTARTLLMQNARHVPFVVDEILGLALSQGGYTPRIP